MSHMANFVDVMQFLILCFEVCQSVCRLSVCLGVASSFYSIIIWMIGSPGSCWDYNLVVVSFHGIGMIQMCPSTA